MIGDFPLPAAVAALLAAAVVVLLAGPRMARLADRLADITGLGEAVVGAVLVGAATSLPDVLATIVPAMSGLPEQAVGNALGGVLGQTAFLAVADIAYRRANLEHAAASLVNVMDGTLLITLLGCLVVIFQTPEVAVLGVHPGTLLLPIVYGYGMRVVSRSSQAPMWRPTGTTETREDEPDEPESQGADARAPWLRFAVLAVVLGVSGWALGRSGEAIAASSGLTGSAVGLFLTGLSSSLAELVVAVSAVRAGALTLAVANVIGGNTFDTLLVGVADVSYREGSVYAEVGPQMTLYAGLLILMTAVLILGLLRRERHGVANIGMETVAVLALYGLGVVLAA